MQKLVLTKRFPASLTAFPITPKTHKNRAFQCGLDQCSIYNMQKLPSNLEEKNQYVHCASVGEKKTHSPQI